MRYAGIPAYVVQRVNFIFILLIYCYLLFINSYRKFGSGLRELMNVKIICPEINLLFIFN